MNQYKIEIKELIQAFKEYRAIPLPKPGNMDELQDADIDIWEENEYIFGHFDTFVRTGKINCEAIEINSTIDSRLEKAREIIKDHDIEKLDALVAYRKRMIRLAELLSKASGIPIKLIDNIEILKRFFIEHKSARTVKEGKMNSSALALDILQEDDHILELVDAFLRRGKLDEKVIEINSTIDSQLEKMYRKTNDKEKLWEYILFRKGTIGLAKLLSEASRVPIKFLNKN